ncbi:redoxin domain-containing protein [Corallococcus terminator]|uniref:TlpA family protein disulfide reductase n=1 Tax=Corallococcus terminator TaxID=2316733 RepID=A0A3A8JBY2_9BACT|nr:redoxin domain-containing protein [Corallococcus terminator]RKG93189.1 TlpA family protein disulfide reductase [Corallococcus terminator]
MLLRPAPAWRTTEWLNTPEPLTLERLRGKVILLHAFQMLCPGCVARGIPQAQRVAEVFAGAPLVVVGLHTVFEHHEAMKLASLRAFLHEYRVKFPVGVDAPGEGGESTPRTMKAYAMQGTPTTVLIDAQGRLRRQVFGVHDDLQLGAELQTLLLEARTGSASGAQRSTPQVLPAAACDDNGCAAPSGGAPG